MTLGNAHDYVQNIDVDPRPLVRHYATLDHTPKPVSDRGDR